MQRFQIAYASSTQPRRTFEKCAKLSSVGYESVLVLVKLPLQTSHHSVLNLFNTTLCNKSRGERIRLRKLGEISTTGVKEEKGLGKECGVRERLRGECHDVTCHADTVDDTLERLFVYIIQIG